MTKTLKDLQQDKQEAEYKITNFVGEVVKELQKDFDLPIGGIYIDTVDVTEIGKLTKRCIAINTKIHIEV